MLTLWDVPTYTYTCTACNDVIEKRQSFSDAPLTTCDQCGGALRKVIHPVGIVFKGSGWYINDSRSSTSSASAPASSASETSKSETSKSEASKSETSKPAGASESTSSGSSSSTSGTGSSGSSSSGSSKPTD